MLVCERIKDDYKYGLIGGHVEPFQTFQDTAAQETHEEAGLDLPPERFHEVKIMNLIDKENNFHYVEMMLACILTSEEASAVYNKEPSEHSKMSWVSWDEFIQLYESGNNELFYSIRELFKAYPKYLDITEFTNLDQNDA